MFFTLQNRGLTEAPSYSTNTALLNSQRRTLNALTKANVRLPPKRTLVVPPLSVSSPPQPAVSQQRRFGNHLLPSVAVSRTIQQPPATKSPKKMLWGQPTWNMFHVLSQTVDENYFLLFKKELLALISNLCANLPCPTCAQHAKEYNSQNGLLHIQTKQEFIHYMFTFHNVVNFRKKIPLYPFERLEADYGSQNPLSAVKHCMGFMQQKNGTFSMMATGMFRDRLVGSINKFMATHSFAFANTNILV